MTQGIVQFSELSLLLVMQDNQQKDSADRAIWGGTIKCAC